MESPLLSSHWPQHCPLLMLIFNDGHQSWVGIVHRDYVTAAGLSVKRLHIELYTGEYKAPK